MKGILILLPFTLQELRMSNGKYKCCYFIDPRLKPLEPNAKKPHKMSSEESVCLFYVSMKAIISEDEKKTPGYNGRLEKNNFKLTRVVETLPITIL